MTATTTVEIDDQGRLTVPKPAREALGIEGEDALVEVTLEVKKRLTEAE